MFIEECYSNDDEHQNPLGNDLPILKYGVLKAGLHEYDFKSVQWISVCVTKPSRCGSFVKVILLTVRKLISAIELKSSPRFKRKSNSFFTSPAYSNSSINHMINGSQYADNFVSMDILKHFPSSFHLLNSFKSPSGVGYKSSHFIYLPCNLISSTILNCTQFYTFFR